MLGIIGGTGLYSFEGLADVVAHTIETPFGAPSAEVRVGSIGGRPVAFLPRHGAGHRLLPGEINFRANIWALKSVGVRRIISVSAVGSLVEEIRPGDLALPSQYLDFTKGIRPHTFFGQGIVAHISSAEPVCRGLRNALAQIGTEQNVPLHRDVVYACVEGPRLGNRAESFFLRGVGARLVGMTNVPEVYLAREAQMCYCAIAVVTDYDCWMEDEAQHGTVDQILQLYRESLGRVQALLSGAIAAVEDDRDCPCRHALDQAVVTPDTALNEQQKERLAFLRS